MRIAKCLCLQETTLTTQHARGLLPTVSVCIPSYNNEGFIARTLESVLQQTYSNFEVIITDDDSMDRTVSEIKRISDPRVRLVQNERNLGHGGNWNRALSYATGKYVKLLCADDLIYQDCLQRQVDALENPSNSGAVLAICNTDVVNAKGNPVFRRKSPTRNGVVSGNKVIRQCVRWGTNRLGEPVAGLFRRDTLRRTGIQFDPANPYMIDLMFWAELLKHGDVFVDEERLGAFRISDTSVSTKIGLKQAASFRSFVRKIRADPGYQISATDFLLGCILSTQWCVLRNFLVRFQSRTVASI